MRVGKYELLIRLASGGAANVFLARDPSTSQLIALKLLLPSLASDEDFVTMFLTEAKIASQLTHPNIVSIADYGQRDGVQLLAMEYVFGASLAQVLRASARAKRPLTVGVLLKLTAEVCGGLHHAHDKADAGGQSMGLVHRDITPQNVLIGFNGVPKLTDFGIAKATNRGWETQAGIVKGKFSYMSPEQAMGGQVDRRSDIFGLGIVLWEALTGKELFGGTTPLEVLNDIRNKRLLPPSKVVPGLTPIVDPIVMKALRRSPEQRFQTAEEMQQAIEALIRRAKVVLDSAAIAKELAAIYGPIVQTRTAALEQARRGNIDPEALAELMGGSVLDPELLPARSPEEAAKDPLGLFAPSDAHTLDLPASGIPAARSDLDLSLPQVGPPPPSPPAYGASLNPSPVSTPPQAPPTSIPHPVGPPPVGPPSVGPPSAGAAEQTDDLPRRQRQAGSPPPPPPPSRPDWRAHAEPPLPAGVDPQSASEQATVIGRPQAAPSAEVMSFEDMERSLLQEFSEPPSPALNPFDEETVAAPEGALPAGAYRPDHAPTPAVGVATPAHTSTPPADQVRAAPAFERPTQPVRAPPPPAAQVRAAPAFERPTQPVRTPPPPADQFGAGPAFESPTQPVRTPPPSPFSASEPARTPPPSPPSVAAGPPARTPPPPSSASYPAPTARVPRTPLPPPGSDWAEPAGPSVAPAYYPRSSPGLRRPLPPSVPTPAPSPQPIPAVVIPKPPSSESHAHRKTDPRVRRLPQTDPLPVDGAITQPKMSAESPLHEPALPREVAQASASSDPERTLSASPHTVRAPEPTSPKQEQALQDELSAALTTGPVSIDIEPPRERDEAPTQPRAEVQRAKRPPRSPAPAPESMSPLLKWLLIIPAAAALILLGVVLAVLVLPD